MSVIRYKCTNCNREIELIEQPTGLETIGGCVITNRCRGRMYRLERLEDFAVGKFPSDVTGLTNYIKRNVLYDHTQAIADSVWLVEHDLGVNPSVQVLVNREELIDGVVVKSRLEIEPQSITLIDKNNLTIRFDRPESGLAQVIARSSAFTQTVETIDPGITYLPVSQSNILTIGIDCESGQFPAGTTAGLQLVRIYYLDQQTLDETAFESAVYKDYEARSPVSTSAWNDVSEIFVNGQIYTVMTIDIGDPVTDIGAPSAGTVLFQAGTSTSGFPYDQSPNMVVLLSNPPHQNVDKNRNQLFRPDLDVGPALTLDSFIFAAGEILIDQTKIEGVFPPIFAVSNPQNCPVPTVVVPVVPVEGAFVIATSTFGSEGAAENAQWISDDDITTWTGKTMGFPVTGIGFMSISGMTYSSSQAKFVGVHPSSSNVHVYSTDDGDTWTAAARVDFHTPRSIAYDPIQDIFVTGGNSGQIQRSSDGITWVNSEPRTSGTFGSSIISGMCWAKDIGMFFCSTSNNEVGRSSDGINWVITATEPGGASSNDQENIYAVGTRIIVGGQIAFGGSTIPYYSDDNGDTWNTPTIDIVKAGDNRAIAANADGSIIMVGAGWNNAGNHYRSTDGGGSYTRVNDGVAGSLLHDDMIYDPDYGFIIVGSQTTGSPQVSHIMTSPDGLAPWTIRSNTNVGDFKRIECVSSKNAVGR